MRRILLSGVFVLATGAVFAQQANVTKYTAPLAGKVVLSDVDDKYTAQVFNVEASEPDGEADKERLEEAKKKSAMMFPRKMRTAQKKTTAAPSPVVTIDFIADSMTGVPPDNYMAISKDDKAVSVVNSLITTIDGKTGKISKRTSLKAYSVSAGLNTFNDRRFDPKIIFDPVADRYISVMLNSTNNLNYIVIGFSQSSDPEGGWNFYKFYGDYKSDTTWFDYPTIAFTKDEFFLSGNKIRFGASWELGFSESVIYQIDKKSGYDGDTALTYQIWDGINYGGKAIRNLFPVKASWDMTGPEQYFLSNRNFDVQNDTMFLIKLPDVISSGNKNLTIQVLQTPVKYGMPPNGRQPDTSAVLATNDARVLGAMLVDDEIQFVSTSVHPGNGSAAILHGIISDFKNNPSISYADFITVDTLDFGYPNISFVGNGWGLNQALISFNYTGPNDYPGLGAVLFDGSQYSDLVRVKEGTGSIKVLSQKDQRWGDYTGSQVDWNAQGAVWIEGIYGRSDNLYGNWMARLSSPLLNVKEQSKPNNNIKVYPNPASEFLDMNFTLQEEGVIKFAIIDVQGRVVDNILEQKCEKGKNILRFNIGTLPAGTYFLKAQDVDGGSVMTQRFVKQ